MSITLAFILEAIALLAGVALIVYARPLSVRFNAETPANPPLRSPDRTRKSRQTRRPPPPPINLKTAATLFRIAGIFLVLGTLLPLIAIALTRHR
jgi:hypothetical protein